MIARNAKSNSTNGCLVYSVGSNNRVDFEVAVHNFMGCEIHTFDPTLGNKPFLGKRFAAFHPWGLGPDGQEVTLGKHSWTAKSFETIITTLGHTGRTIDVLKIDCEGCEYKTVTALFDLIADGKVKVDQILVELHVAQSRYGSPEDLNTFFTAMDKAGMRIFHKERNQWGCDGYRCVEYALISDSFLRQANKAVICRAHRVS